ncbi:juvenile hormone esterase-like [Anticarsia gemmatalis]|uniref:juvenile hormone esterase-like n=1 Tax=Anticarsia gemmatalis TaxID=129554 RepID=UPI003F777499
MVEVKVQQGWLRGEKLDTVTGDGQYYSFKGIPYAQPPLGKLRFRAPQPPLPWEGVRQATEHGPKCPQLDIFTRKYEPGSEDCLHLNVYSPNLKPTSPLAVMVFIHGGGYKSGSGNEDNYGPDFLVSHGVVLVTINYRLDALGFLCLDTEEVPGNAGLKDQVAALRWVKANISNFGGDPNNVTVFGESAGGASTSLHIVSPMSKGLFQRAIPMSGVPSCDWSMSFMPQKRAFVLGKILGFETNDPNELLEFLQKVPVEKLVDTNPTVMSFEDRNNNILKMYHFTPVVEKDFGKEQFLTEDHIEILKKGKINDVDVLLGHTSQETLVGIERFEESFIKDYNRYTDLLVPRKILVKCTAEQIMEASKKIFDFYFKDKAISVKYMKEYVTYCNHVCFLFDIYNFLNKLPKTGKNRRYMYIFSCSSSRNVYGNQGLKYDIKGAAHLDDLMYMFDAKQFGLKIEKNTKEYDLVQLACTVFTNFAKYGNPTPDASLGVTWPEFDNKTRAYVDIGDTLTTGTNRDAEALQFWTELYKSVGLQC